MLALQLPNSPFARFTSLELGVLTNVEVSNPFDPAQIDLVVHFVSPSGKTLTTPAFYYQDYDPASLQPKGDPGWKARFTPTEDGPWTAQAELKTPDLQLQSEVAPFTVSPSTAHGFVRVNPANPRYLAFDDGAPFFPIGINLGWAKSDALKDYQHWLDALTQNGGNAGRVWMASWSFGIEWSDTGLGNYTARLKQAWLLDQIFRLAEARDFYFILVLLNHGAFSTTVNPEWDGNPYNAAHGGPCAQPECFAADPQAKEFFQRRLRYIIARWGYSPNLLAWEWWNEVDLTPIPASTLQPWIKEMTADLRRLDVNQHLTTISYAGGNPPAIWNMPEIDLPQRHLYTTQDLGAYGPKFYQETASALDQPKPILLGEFGYSTGIEDTTTSEHEGIHLHNGLWGSTFSGFAASGMYWWWDTYVDPLNLWPHFKGLSQFIRGEDLAGLSPVKAHVKPHLAGAVALMNQTRALIWIKDDDYDTLSVTIVRNVKPKEEQGTVSWDFLSDLTLTLSGLDDGGYRAHWYSPTTAEFLSEETTQVQNGELTLAVPDFQRDLAVKVEKLP